MRRALAYRPRFNAPPRPRPERAAIAPRPRSVIAAGIWWFLGAVLLFAAVARTVQGQSSSRHPSAPHDSALAVATADSAWSRLATAYYDTTFRGNDWQAVRRELRTRAERSRSMPELRSAIEAMFARLGESHFALIPGDAVAGWNDAPDEGGAVGDVGIEVRLLDGDVVVSRVRAGSAAAQAGIRAGWLLQTLGELEVADFMRRRLDVPAGSARRLAELQLPLSLMARTQGTVGSVVSLGLRDGAGRERRVQLARRAVRGDLVRFGHLPAQFVRLETERHADARGCVGVVRFNVWMTPVMPRFDDAMVEFARCRGLVLDLRGNVGGVAAMVMGLGGYLLDSTVSLGTMTTRTATLRYVTNPRRSDRQGGALAPFAGPVAILVDGLSVSTSEIFAAGLQQLGRARIFGEATAGQALPAMIAQLPNGDVMQYVVADFTAPDGRRIEARGVIPDERIPLRRRALLDGRDEVLDAARAWIDARTAPTAIVGGR
jgi:carboxyl-terminal processing protease